MAQQIKTFVEINGEEYSPFRRLSLVQRIDFHHEFEIVFNCEVIERELGASLFDKTKELLGKEISIQFEAKIGITKSNSFKGVITDINLERNPAINKKSSADYDVILKGKSLSIYLEGNQRTQHFHEMSVDDIVKKLLEGIPQSLVCNPSSEDTSAKKYIVQYKESNFAFINRLAAQYSCWCYWDGKELVFGKLPDNEKDFDLPFDKDLFDFEVELSLSPMNFETRAFNYEESGEQLFKSKSPDIDVTGELDELGKFAYDKSEEIFNQTTVYSTIHKIDNEKELKDLVEKKKRAQSRNLTFVSGITDNPKANVGQVFEVTEDKGTKYDFGKYLVTSVTHTVDSMGGYQNSLEAIPFKSSTPPFNPNVSQPICESQSAIVTDNIDPDKMGRVKVRFHWLEEGEETPWLRVLQPYAGKGEEGELHGFYFIPEIGDEVFVAFENDNPNTPYVIGSFYHGKAPIPDSWNDNKNRNKIWKTRNGNQIHMIDKDGKEEIRIFNKDENDAVNEIRLSLEGDGKVSISTKGKLDIKAKSIKIEAEDGIEIKSGKDTKLEADNYKLTASKEVSMEGQNIKISGSQKSELSTNELKIDSMQASLKSTAKLDIEGGQSSIKSQKLDINGGAMASITAGLIKLN